MAKVGLGRATNCRSFQETRSLLACAGNLNFKMLVVFCKMMLVLAHTAVAAFSKLFCLMDDINDANDVPGGWCRAYWGSWGLCCFISCGRACALCVIELAKKAVFADSQVSVFVCSACYCCYHAARVHHENQLHAVLDINRSTKASHRGDA